MEVACQLAADKAPVPRLKDVVLIVGRIGENEAVFIGVGLEPGIRSGFIKALQLAALAGADKVHRRAKLVLAVALVRREAVSGAGAVGDFVLAL